MPTAEQIILTPADAKEPWARTLLELCAQAWTRVEQRSGLKLKGPLRVTTQPTQNDFQKYVGGRLTHVVAVALPKRGEIVIHRVLFFAESPDEQLQTIVHELSHLIIAQNVKGNLPAWLNEGLCMIVAGQEGLGFSWRLTVAGSLGGVLPISEMERSLLVGGDLQSLAYAQSLSITRFLIKRTLEYSGRGGDSVVDFLQLLADPTEGPKLVESAWDVGWVDSLERQWKREHRSIWNWIAILSGTSVLWLVITALFLIAYWRKRRMRELAREKLGDGWEDGEGWTPEDEDEDIRNER